MVVFQFFSILGSLLSISTTSAVCCRNYAVKTREPNSPHLKLIYAIGLASSSFFLVLSRAVSMTLFSSYFKTSILLFIVPFAANFFIIVWAYEKTKMSPNFAHALYVTVALLFGFDLFTTHWKGSEELLPGRTWCHLWGFHLMHIIGNTILMITWYIFPGCHQPFGHVVLIAIMSATALGSLIDIGIRCIYERDTLFPRPEENSDIELVNLGKFGATPARGIQVVASKHMVDELSRCERLKLITLPMNHDCLHSAGSSEEVM